MRPFSMLSRRVPVVLAAVGATLAAGLVAAQPASAATNDYFSNAQVISGWSPSVNGDNYGTTAEAGEPAHAGIAARDSVWYSWTAPADAKVTLTGYLNNGTSNSLAVYTGSSLSSLTAVTSSAGTYRTVSFLAVAGRTYKIALDGDGNEYSTHLDLRVVPRNDNFVDAKVLTGSTGSVTGANYNASRQSGEPYPGGVTSAYYTIWYRWTAPTSGVASFSTSGSALDTVLGVYTGSALTGLSTVASNDDCTTDDPGASWSCADFAAVAGTTYQVQVAGYNNTTGNLALSWSQGDSCTVRGTAGNDTLVGTAGDDVICGYEGNDTIKGQGGNDTIVGGPGKDKVDYADAPAGVVVNLLTGTATGQGTDTLREVEDVDGSPFADTLDGDDLLNGLAGKAGNDKLYGHGGNDSVWGGDGNDLLGGGDGNDLLDGRAGTDTVSFTAAVNADLTTGQATGQGSDSLVGIENLNGSPAADRLRGSLVVNVIQGGSGNDTVLGEGGNDSLYGAAGADALTGGAGTDRCDGGTDTDTAVTCETKVSIP